MSLDVRRRVRPWKHLANAAKLLCALQIPVGFWAGHLTGHPVDPWPLAQVSLWTYAFFSPVDVGLIIGAIKDTIQAAKAPGHP